MCVAECPNTYWENGNDRSDPLCSPCDDNCLWCNTSATDCTLCKHLDVIETYLDLLTNICVGVDGCPNEYFEDATTRANPLCSPCDENCLWCNTNATDCTLCDRSKYPKRYLYLEDAICMTECPISLYEDNNLEGTHPEEAPRDGPLCSPCDEKCIECYGATEENCTRCFSTWFLSVPDLNPNICYAPCRLG